MPLTSSPAAAAHKADRNEKKTLAHDRGHIESKASRRPSTRLGRGTE